MLGILPVQSMTKGRHRFRLLCLMADIPGAGLFTDSAGRSIFGLPISALDRIRPACGIRSDHGKSIMFGAVFYSSFNLGKQLM